MIEYYGESKFRVFIPRKPKDTGLRAYLHCFRLNMTGQPVCVHILPDFILPFFKPIDVLDDAIASCSANIPIQITIDAFFGNIDWMMNQ